MDLLIGKPDEQVAPTRDYDLEKAKRLLRKRGLLIEMVME